MAKTPDPDYDLILDEHLAKNEWPKEKMDKIKGNKDHQSIMAKVMTEVTIHTIPKYRQLLLMVNTQHLTILSVSTGSNILCTGEFEYDLGEPYISSNTEVSEMYVASK